MRHWTDRCGSSQTSGEALRQSFVGDFHYFAQCLLYLIEMRGFPLHRRRNPGLPSAGFRKRFTNHLRRSDNSFSRNGFIEAVARTLACQGGGGARPGTTVRKHKRKVSYENE